MRCLSVDTETNGLDPYHGCRPFLITTCDKEGEQNYWKATVDPLTRKCSFPPKDRREIKEHLLSYDKWYFQNPVFDITQLFCAGFKWIINEWHRVRDTGLAAHLVNSSNKKKDLTTLVLQYLGINIQPYELRVRKEVHRAHNYCRRHLPDWRIAAEGDPMLPSGAGWKADMWLLEVLAEELGYCKGECTVVNKRKDDFTVYIGRGSIWGNPYVIGKDGTRKQVIKKYEVYARGNKEIMSRIEELDQQVLGCFCKPQACHGDVLQKILAERRHKWYTVGLEYALADTASTLPLGLHLERIIRKEGLWKNYVHRTKLLRINHTMQFKGITINGERTHELNAKYTKEARTLGKQCRAIARSVGIDLTLPKSGNNDALLETVFGENGFNLEPVERSKKTGKPSLDKKCIETHLIELEPKTKPYRFLKYLSDKRSRDTASGTFLTGYVRAWLPAPGYPTPDPVTGAGWYVLHPSLNPVGAATLRWSSSNPNSQNVSKKKSFNLRYCFGPAPGREWWSMDAKNIELRIPGYESGEQELIDLFEKPDDPPYYGSEHLLNFSTVYPDIWEQELNEVGYDRVGPHIKDKYADTWYGFCKNGDFAIQYGAVELDDVEGTADKAFHRLGSHSRLRERFAKKEKLNRYWIDYANKHGYVETLPDKYIDPKRGYPLVCPFTKYGSVKETIPLSYHVQSTAMQWMNQAMIRCSEYLDELNRDRYGVDTIHLLADPKLSQIPNVGYFLIAQIHDEMLFDMPKGKSSRTNLPVARELGRLMELGGEGIGIPTPVSCEYHDTSWSEGESISV